MHHGLAALACAFLLSPAAAQIVGLEPLGDARKRLRKFLVTKNGRTMICGEPLEGMDVAGNVVRKHAKPEFVTLLVPDPSKPERELTRITRKGARRVLSKRYQVTLEKGEFHRDRYHLVFRYQSLAGLRAEYLRKKQRVDALKKRLAKARLGTPAWFAAHRGLVGMMDSLASWLDDTVYPGAAARVRKDIASLMRRARGGASASRLAAAKDSLGRYEIPRALLDCCERNGFGGVAWHGKQTDHLRIVTIDDISEPVIDGALLLGETIIEGVRSTLVDPFLGEDDVDPIPKKLFKEWIFIRDEDAMKVMVYEKYLGFRFTAPRQRRIELAGTRGRGGAARDYFELWRNKEGAEVEGIVAHGLGHTLGNIIYNRSKRGGPPAWLDEGFAYWTSFEFLSRNSVTCFAFSVPRYAKSAEKEGVKVVETGARAAFNSLALREGPPLDKLLRQKLVEMGTPDVCKAWSFLDYIFLAHPKQADGFLKAVCAAPRTDGRTRLEELRATAERFFPVEPGGDVYRNLDQSWRKFAKSEQLSARRRRR